MPERSLHEQNRLSWNHATVAHNSHRGDQAAHYRKGDHKLFAEDLELLGDIRGLDAVHLQCNSGQDTLSLALLGANVTGVDISDTAIEFARGLSRDSGIPAGFVRSDVYDWLEETGGSDRRFDLVYASYGALCWLSDIRSWAQGIAQVLKPGGRLVVVEFHPVVEMHDEHGKHAYNYDNGGEPFHEETGVNDYVAVTGSTGTGYEPGIVNFQNAEPAYAWSWGIGEVVTALIDAGLTLRTLREWMHANGWKPFHSMQQREDGAWVLPQGEPNMPLMFGVVAQKPGTAGSGRK